MRNFVLMGLLLTLITPARADINKFTVHVTIHAARHLKGYNDPIYHVKDCNKAIARFIRSAKNKAKFHNHYIDFACTDNRTFSIKMIKKTKWFKRKVTIEHTTEPLPAIK